MGCCESNMRPIGMQANSQPPQAHLLFPAKPSSITSLDGILQQKIIMQRNSYYSQNSSSSNSNPPYGYSTQNSWMMSNEWYKYLFIFILFYLLMCGLCASSGADYPCFVILFGITNGKVVGRYFMGNAGVFGGKCSGFGVTPLVWFFY